MQVNIPQEEPLYGTLVISCSSSPPEDIIKLILGTPDLPEAEQIDGKVRAYPWHIETKYYHADVHLFSTNGKDLVSNNFADGVQAVVIYFDSNCSNRFEEVKSWQPFIDQFSPEVQILVCDNCSNTDTSRSSSLTKRYFLNWCLQNSYELVELNPEEASDDEGEDDFKETTGYKRIIQALHAHLWPNMEMKDNPCIGTTPARLEEMLKTYDEAPSEPVEQQIGSSSLNNALTDETTETEESSLSHLLSELNTEENISFDSSDPTSYEGLFERFRGMKERANHLQGEERRQYAEKVAIAFWRAMGGDEAEIAGLSSDDDQ